MYANIYSNVFCKSSVIFIYAFYREKTLNQGVEILHLLAMNPGSAPVAQDQDTRTCQMALFWMTKHLKTNAVCRRTKKPRGLVCSFTCVSLSCWNHGSVLIIAGICDQNTSYFRELRTKWDVIISLDDWALWTDVNWCFMKRIISIVWRMAKFHSLTQEINTATVLLQLCTPDLCFM